MSKKIYTIALFSLLMISATQVLAGDSGSPNAGEEKTHKSSDDHSSSRISDTTIPLNPELVPQRLKPLLELGEPFLGTGTLSPGIQLPTGAVWQPSLLVFGTFRTAYQNNGFDSAQGDVRNSEIAARLDLFANLQLSGSERIVLGFRNLDQDGRFTAHTFENEATGIRSDTNEEINANISSLFFEGDLGEIFPGLSPRDFRGTDIGFSVGRQPLLFQEGMLVNDTVEGIGLTWNSLQPRRTSNFRTTFFYGWDHVDRNGVADNTGDFLALFTSLDTRRSTIDIDLAYSLGDEDAEEMLGFGLSTVQRFGHINTSFRLLGSAYMDDGGSQGGYLFANEISWTPHHSHNLVYINSFWAYDTYLPIAQGAGNGGPLARIGINFEGVGLGSYATPISAEARDAAGGAIGYQMFFAATRQQLILELGAKSGLEDDVYNAYAATIRYQAALGHRFVFILDGYATQLEQFDSDIFFGGRVELTIRF